MLVSVFCYDYHGSFGGETLSSVGLTYFIDEGLQFKASYGDGYKAAPTTEQLYKSWEVTGKGRCYDFNLLGIPDLKLEKSKGFEFFYKNLINVLIVSFLLFKEIKRCYHYEFDLFVF